MLPFHIRIWWLFNPKLFLIQFTVSPNLVLPALFLATRQTQFSFWYRPVGISGEHNTKNPLVKGPSARKCKCTLCIIQHAGICTPFTRLFYFGRQSVSGRKHCSRHWWWKILVRFPKKADNKNGNFLQTYILFTLKSTLIGMPEHVFYFASREAYNISVIGGTVGIK